MQSKLRRRMATSPIGRGAALPLRTLAVARYDARVIGRSLDWLAHSRETTNYTYDLALSTWISSVGSYPPSPEPRLGRCGRGPRNWRRTKISARS